MKSVGIIGGGITGLTAAYRLQQQGMAVTLYEASDRVGGVIRTVARDGFLAECGPNTILETSPVISQLIKDVGLENRRRYSSPTATGRYLVRDGKPERLPDSLCGFVRTRLFSSKAKMRLLAEPFIRRSCSHSEESVEQFVLRRLGREFLDYAINPLVGGIYAGDPARLSVKHAFPKLLAVEQRYHSLILGQALGARERRRRGEVSKQNAPKFSFDAGLQVLTEELGRRLSKAILRDAVVTALRADEDSWQVRFQLGSSELVDSHDAVLFAGTAPALARLQVAAANHAELARMADVVHAPVTTLSFGFRRKDVSHSLDGFGVLIPEVEGFNILGVIFSSSLFENRAPEGHVLLTCYMGGSRSPKLAALDGDSQVKLALEDLRRLLGVTGEPVFQHRTVYKAAIPQYEVGYGTFRQAMAKAESECPGFFLAGSYRDGISLGDSIVSGHAAAGRIASYLGGLAKPSGARGSGMKEAA